MTKSASRRRNLTEGSIQDAMVRLTLPMILGMVMLFTFSLVDTLFISFLGTEALTAISFTFPVTFTIMSLAIGLGIGASAVVGKCLGEAREEQANEAATVINYLSFGLACLVVAVLWLLMDTLFPLMGAGPDSMGPIREYMVVWLPGSVIVVCIMTGNSVLRACGDTKTPSLLMAGAGFINAVLDPVLIFGLGPIPAMGIAGAAWATAISWAIGFVFLMYTLVVRLEMVSPTLPDRAVLFKSGGDMLRIGIPAAGANMMTPLAMGVMTAIAASFGDSAVAAFGVGARLEPIATLLVLAMSTSLPPMISQNFGARRLDRVEQAYRLSLRFIMAWQLIVYVVLALAGGLIASVFSSDPIVVDTIRLFILIMPLGYGLQGIVILSNSALNALHRPMAALSLSFMRFFVFYVPLAWLGSEMLGLAGFFAGAVCGNLLMSFLSLRAFNEALAREQAGHGQLPEEAESAGPESAQTGVNPAAASVASVVAAAEPGPASGD